MHVNLQTICLMIETRKLKRNPRSKKHWMTGEIRGKCVWALVRNSGPPGPGPV